MFGGMPRLKHFDLGNLLPRTTNATFVPTGNSFSGSLPPSLGNCSSLQYLSVRGNVDLGGDIPLQWNLLTKLQVLQMSVCSVTGALPAWLGNMSSLQKVYMTQNLLSGRVPDALGKLSNLLELSFDDNSLSGPVPLPITNCTNLASLDLGQNSLTGDMSDFLFEKLSATLTYLNVADNALTGFIPSSIANCSSLENLQLGVNPFHAQTIPTWIGSFPNMTLLHLGRMHLYGDIPRDIGKLQELQILQVAHQNLTGVIPPSLANCSALVILAFETNQLTGTIPPELGHLSSLSQLYAAENFLTGSVPLSFSNLSQLTELDLEYNLLTGSIGVLDWGRLSQLQYIHMDSNRLAGSIPLSLSNCSALTFIDFSSNDFTGPIPASLGNLSRKELQVLDLSSNQISGSIPADLFRSSRLMTLSLHDNNLEGIIPSEIGESSFLQPHLVLSQNGLHGNVPESLGNCSELLELQLSHNQLNGSLTLQLFSNMVHLAELDLSYNLFSGAWPQQLGSLPEIQTIQLSANNLSGSILLLQSKGSQPWNVLESLDVSLNRLDGPIPESLGLLPKLTFLNVSYNSFQGSIPVIGIFQRNLTRASFLGNPGLCGDILGPGRECPSTGRNTCEGLACRRVWIPMVCAGLGLLLAAIFMITIVIWLRAVRGRRQKEQILISDRQKPLMRITESEIENIVCDGKENVIGRGAYCVVYKGSRPSGETFAIKIINPDGSGSGSKSTSRHNEEQLLQEVHTLAQIRHRNVLRVLSYCSGIEIKAIILEYMPKGSLHKHLYAWGVGSCQLSFQTRVDIAMGTAEGMKYLHHDLPRPLIHGDLKPTNILLDSDFTAKVADFGLAKFVREQRGGGEDASASTIRGTIGYIPPEYAFGGMSTRGDVYGFGVVLLELLTCTPPIGNPIDHEDGLSVQANEDTPIRAAGRAPGTDEPGPSEGYRSRSLNLYKENPLQMVDAKLREESASDSRKGEQMKLLLLVALLCTRERPKSRPTMSDVSNMLAQINELGTDAVTARRPIEELVKGDPLQQNLP